MNGLVSGGRFAGVVGSVLLSFGCQAGPDGPRELGTALRAGAELAFPDAEGEPGEGMFHVGNKLQTLAYQIEEGHAVHEGDIILGNMDQLSPMQLGEEGVTEAAVKPDSLWHRGVVPYVLDAGLPDATIEAFFEAVAHWEDLTALRFVPRNGQTDYVRVVHQGGCASNIGRTGGEQLLYLGPGCETMGIAAHELGHAIGFWHEQSRADRDQHVIINWDNIQLDRIHQFFQYEALGFLGEDVGGYNVDSVMHYDSFAFSLGQNLPTITRLDGSTFAANRTGLTNTDLEGATRLYGPPGAEDECGSIWAGTRLGRGDARMSCDGRFVLIMQDDGNLVLYREHEPLWHTSTHGTGASSAVMQDDGNLVVYDDGGKPLWASNTDGNKDSVLIVQDDGNLVIYDVNYKPIWASDTCCR